MICRNVGTDKVFLQYEFVHDLLNGEGERIISRRTCIQKAFLSYEFFDVQGVLRVLWMIFRNADNSDEFFGSDFQYESVDYSFFKISSTCDKFY